VLVEAFAKLDMGSVPAWIGLAGAFIALATWLGRRRAAALRVYVVATKWRWSQPPKDTDFTNYKIVNNGTLLIRHVRVSVWGDGKRRWFWRFRHGERWMTGERLEGRIHHAVEPGSPAKGTDMMMPTSWLQKAKVREPRIMLIFEQGRRTWVQWPDSRLNRVYWGPRWHDGAFKRAWATVKTWATPPNDR